jgi:hypothetical protein
VSIISQSVNLPIFERFMMESFRIRDTLISPLETALWETYSFIYLSGAGVSDEQIEQLNHSQHYMVCDCNVYEHRHGLGLLIVKQIIDGHYGKTIIDHSKYGGFKASPIIPTA